MIRDVLIPVRTFPEADTGDTVASLLRLASTFATHATLSPLVLTSPGIFGHWSGAFTGLKGRAAEIEKSSLDAARELLAQTVNHAGLKVTGRELRMAWGEPARSLTSSARCHDLTMVAFTEPTAAVAMAEASIFGTGRPAMLLPRELPDSSRPFSRIAVAWDASGTASRALYDAMPLLTQADEVIVINAPGDKTINDEEVAQLSEYLARHEINFRFAKAKIDLHDIGLALQYCAKTNGAELLVMGAFGQGRLQQFVLGGATRHVLNHLQLPVFMSNS